MMRIALVLAGAIVAAQDVSRIGPQPRERVPGFTAVDQRGRTHTLESLMGPKGVMLVFFRSADW
jgi:hypothetical protein